MNMARPTRDGKWTKSGTSRLKASHGLRDGRDPVARRRRAGQRGHVGTGVRRQPGHQRRRVPGGRRPGVWRSLAAGSGPGVRDRQPGPDRRTGPDRAAQRQRGAGARQSHLGGRGPHLHRPRRRPGGHRRLALRQPGAHRRGAGGATAVATVPAGVPAGRGQPLPVRDHSPGPGGTADVGGDPRVVGPRRRHPVAGRAAADGGRDHRARRTAPAGISRRAVAVVRRARDRGRRALSAGCGRC